MGPPSGNSVKKVVLVAFCVFVLVWMAATFSRTTASKSGEPTAANAAAVAAFQKGVAASLGISSPKWSGLQVDEASGSNYKLVLVYGEMPTGQAEVERDTRRVAQAALDQLVKQGRKPARERIFVTVRAHMPETGATGQSLVRVFGRAVYDYNNDSIQYKAEK